MGEVIRGPRWINPLRVRLRRQSTGWEASYRRRDSGWAVRGCDTAREALGSLCRFVLMDVQEVDGKWKEVPR